MADVILHVYDVTNSGNGETKDTIIQINEIFNDGVVQGGVFHSAVQVYGNEEWSFGCCEQGSGVFSCPSTKNPTYTFRQSIKLGSTSLPISKVNQILLELSEEWHGHSYDSVSKNCNNFCDEFCDRLGLPKQQLPLKKRRHLLRPTSPRDSSSLEEKDKIHFQCFSSVLKSLSSFPNLPIDKQFLDGSGKEFDRGILAKKEKMELSVEGGISGLKLLAAAASAASMDIDSDIPIKEGGIVESSSIPKSFDTFSLATDSEIGSKCDESDYAMVHTDLIGYSQVLNNTSDASQGLLYLMVNRNKPRSTLKVDRRHWDLNTVMDSWDKPYDDSISGHISKDVTDGVMHVSRKDEHVDDDLAVLYSNSTGVETPNVKIEEIKLKAVSPGRTSLSFPNHEDRLQEPNSISSNVGSESSAEAAKKVVVFPTTSLSSTLIGEKIQSPVALMEKIHLLVDASHESDMFLDDHGHTVDRAEIMCSEGRDSPYEDGELRGSFLCSLEDYELDDECIDYESNGRNDGSDAANLHGSEIVDVASESSYDSDRKGLLKGLSGNKRGSSVMEQSNRKYFAKATSKKDEFCGKIASNEESVTGENEEGIKGRSTDLSGFGDKVSQLDEYMLKSRLIKLQSATSCSSLDATDEKDVFLMQQRRSRYLGGTVSCSERDAFSDKYSSKYRPIHFNERDGADWWTNWGSRSRHSSAYLRVEDRSDSVDKFGRLSLPGERHAAHYSSKGFHGSSSRSPNDREDCFGVPRRVPGSRRGDRYMSGNYSRTAGRDFGQNFDSLTDDTANIVRMPPYTSRRERSISPSSNKSFRVSSTRKRSPSKFKARSPMPWHSLVERNLSSRKHIRSRDFRSEARDDRLPISKPTFSFNCREERYLSPPRSRLSHDRDDRWSYSHNFQGSHMKMRKSPLRVFRSAQKRDSISSGHLKSDEFYRPTTHTRRFSFISYNDRGSKFENYEERKLESSDDMMHRGQYACDGGNLRRFRQTNPENGFETGNSNEDAVRRTYPKDVPQRWERKH